MRVTANRTANRLATMPACRQPTANRAKRNDRQGNCGAVRHLGRCRGRRAGQRELAGLPTAGAGGEGGDREKRRRRERLWCGPEKLPTLQETGGWGSRKRGGPRKARTSKSGGRVVRAWKSVAGELVVPGKARPGKATGLWAWKSGGGGVSGGVNNCIHDEGWRLSTGVLTRDGGARAEESRSRRQRAAGGGAGGDSGRPMAAGSYFSSQPKRRRSPKRRKSSSRPPEVL